MWHKVHKAGQKCISIEGKRLGRLPPFENAQWGKVNLPPPAANQIFVGAGSTARYAELADQEKYEILTCVGWGPGEACLLVSDSVSVKAKPTKITTNIETAMLSTV